MSDARSLGELIANNHWEQGSVLPGPLAAQAIALRPAWMQGPVSEEDWLVVVSHPCDLVNPKADNEPAVEILRFTPRPGSRADSGFILGKNPRRMHVLGLSSAGDSGTVVLHAWAHDKWPVPRELLQAASPEPDRRLPPSVVTQVALWLSKRFVRSAFPGSFDDRWRGPRLEHLKAWLDLMKTHSNVLAGVYLRLTTEAELVDPNLSYGITVQVLFVRK